MCASESFGDCASVYICRSPVKECYLIVCDFKLFKDRSNIYIYNKISPRTPIVMRRSFDVELPTLTLQNRYFIHDVNYSRSSPDIPIYNILDSRIECSSMSNAAEISNNMRNVLFLNDNMSLLILQIAFSVHKPYA